mgnify:CR=1 FL=1
MRIVLTVNAAWNILNFRKPLARALLDDGHELTVLAPADDAANELIAMGCNFMPLVMDNKGINPLRDLQLLARMRRHLAELRPDVVLGYTIKPNIYGALAARQLGIAFIPNVTGLGTAFLSMGATQRVIEWLYRISFAKLPTVLFQNEDDEALFLERKLIRASQAKRLPGSGIDLAEYSLADYPEESSEVIFLLIARVLRDKGVAEFVEAAQILQTKYPFVRCQLLGATDSENRTTFSRAQVDRWVEAGRIEYLGTAPDVRPLIRKAHAVVLPSYREGAPRTLIEASAMGRPVIASDVPGCRSVVEDGETGFLCAVRSGTSLADTMERFLLLNYAHKVEMGLAARRKMEREFSVERVIETYRELLTGLQPKVEEAA